MTDEVVPRGLAEAMTVASIAWEAGDTTAVAHPDCVCNHSYEHHDGFGCAEVHKGMRCGCEHYAEGKPRGTVSDID